MTTIEIDVATALDPSDLEALRRLLPQLEAIIDLAETRGLRTLDLTSRPTRTAAIALYESVGFVRRDSTLMRYAGVLE
jgi:hypothetical protein